ncbi:MAG: M23 family metallopeptidase [Oscillospiraceae bacterium]
MKSRALLAAFLFLCLTAMKVFLPEQIAGLRETLVPAIVYEPDLRADILALGRSIAGKDKAIYVQAELEHSPAQTESLIKPDISADFPKGEMTNQNMSGFSPPARAEPSPSPEPSAKVAALSLPSSPPAPEIPTPNQAIVDAFLAEQAAFSDRALPVNVSYNAPVFGVSCTRPSDAAVGSGFGYRVHPIRGDVRFHYGCDFSAGEGNSISAFADGTVIAAQEISGYGNTVMLDHGNGFTTLYAHCSKLLVNMGDKVTSGSAIALVGHSGNVTGPHLHFEIMQSGIYLNPEFYLPDA